MTVWIIYIGIVASIGLGLWMFYLAFDEEGR